MKRSVARWMAVAGVVLTLAAASVAVYDLIRFLRGPVVAHAGGEHTSEVRQDSTGGDYTVHQGRWLVVVEEPTLTKPIAFGSVALLLSGFTTVAFLVSRKRPAAAPAHVSDQK